MSVATQLGPNGCADWSNDMFGLPNSLVPIPLSYPLKPFCVREAVCWIRRWLFFEQEVAEAAENAWTELALETVLVRKLRNKIENPRKTPSAYYFAALNNGGVPLPLTKLCGRPPKVSGNGSPSYAWEGGDGRRQGHESNLVFNRESSCPGLPDATPPTC